MNKSLFIFLLIFSFFSFGCTGSDRQTQTTPNRNNPQTSSTPKEDGDTLKEAIEYGKNGQFRYIFSFKRLDDQVMNSEDFEYLKTNSPVQVNYFLKADKGLYAVACSNFPFEEKHFTALKKRFKVEDHSDKK